MNTDAPRDSTVSLTATVAIVTASMIGIGVFTSVGFMIEAVPSAFAILALWLLGGLVSYCGALCYAELVALFPQSGGEYHLLTKSLHPFAGFLAGWISMVAGFAAPIVVLAMAFASYAEALGWTLLPSSATAAAVIVLVAALHFGRLKVISAFLSSLTFLKVGLILAFIIAALAVAPSAPTTSLAPRKGDLALFATREFAGSFVYVMFAYSGWNAAAYIAGEVRNARRLVPWSFGIGIGIVTVLYVALNAIFLARAPWSEISGQLDSAVVAAKSIFGDRGGRIMAGLIALGTLSTIAAYTWSGSRVFMRMGQDYQRLAWLARKNAAGAPTIALLVQTTIALVLLMSGTFAQILNYLTGLLVLSGLLVVIGVPVVRWRSPNLNRPFRVPLYPLPVLVCTVAFVWMLTFQSMGYPRESALGLATLAIGGIMYGLVRRL